MKTVQKGQQTKNVVRSGEHVSGSGGISIHKLHHVPDIYANIPQDMASNFITCNAIRDTTSPFDSTVDPANNPHYEPSKISVAKSASVV